MDNQKHVQKYFYTAHRRLADRDRAFLEIMTGPNPLTPEEIRKLVEKNPERYGRYKAWGER